MTACLLRRLAALATATLVAAAARVPAQPLDVAPPPAVETRPDQRRAEQPVTVQLFDRPVALRLGYELTLERRRNFDLDDSRDRDRRVRDQELTLEARLQASDRVTLLAEAVFVSELRRRPATGEVDRQEGTQRGQLWLQVDGIGGTPWALQVGRIALVDRRAWWWDEDLDAVRVLARGDAWRFETGVGREIARAASTDSGIALRDRGVRRWWAQGAWNWTPRHTLEAFWLQASDGSGTPPPGSLWADDDVDPVDARLRWLGLRGTGSLRADSGGRWACWAELAAVAGSQVQTSFGEAGTAGTPAGASTTRRVRGHAVDLGTQWTWALPLRPVASLAWAQGSGAADGAGTDRNFRQTGLQENKARLGGVKRLQRYGELLDPELSNLRVTTVGLGLRLADATSAELVWHRYRQVAASVTLAGSRLSQAPEGTGRDIGRELDLVVAWREWQHAELTLSWSRFAPGTAFAAERRDTAHAVALGLELNF